MSISPCEKFGSQRRIEMINQGQRQGELETYESYREPKLLPNISSGLELCIVTRCHQAQRKTKNRTAFRGPCRIGKLVSNLSVLHGTEGEPLRLLGGCSGLSNFGVINGPIGGMYCDRTTSGRAQCHLSLTALQPRLRDPPEAGMKGFFSALLADVDSDTADC